MLASELRGRRAFWLPLPLLRQAELAVELIEAAAIVESVAGRR